MRTAVSFLLIGMMTGAAACTLAHRSARNPVPGGGLRRFYLTKAAFQGNKALTACGAGYHMASRFEIWDVTVLDYDDENGLTTEDSGSGPPSEAASYQRPGAVGWVRTGGDSQFTDAKRVPGAAFTNCATWASNSHEAYGTVAYLTARFTVENTAASPVWSGGSEPCDTPYRVWCVEDAPPRQVIAPGPTTHRRRRFGGPESELRP